MSTTVTCLGTARTVRDLVEVESWRGLAALDPTDPGAGYAAELSLHTHERADDGGLYATVAHGATAAYTSVVVGWRRVTDHGTSRVHQPERALVETLSPVIPAADWRTLVLLWERWHFQALSPGCVHQTPPAGADVATALASVADCPEDGYRFGSGWLVRDLPADLRARARQVGAALELSR